MASLETDGRYKAVPPLKTPTDLPATGVETICTALNHLLADVFALYLKTKNFHWHMSGPHFRDYHLLLDDQADAILGTTDDLAERIRKIGGTTLRSIGHIARLQSIQDNDQDFVPPIAMLNELAHDNQAHVIALRQAHDLCDKLGDVATASLIEMWIDAAEKRLWFLFEITRDTQAIS